MSGIITLLVIAALAVWGAVSSIIAISRDSYGHTTSV